MGMGAVGVVAKILVGTQIAVKPDHLFGNDIPQGELPDPGGIDHPAAERKTEQFGGRRRVLPLLGIGVDRPDITVTADPAFTLESITDEQAKKILSDEGVPLDGERIGVSVRAWNKAKYGDDYVKKLAEACDMLAEQGKTIVLLPMEYPRDLEISQKVVDNMKRQAYVLKNRYKPSEILGLVGCFDLMISMRLHTLIFAAVKNVPMLGVIYDPKVEYYLKELEMPEAGDVRTKRLNSTEIVAKARDVFGNMQAYKDILRKNADVMCEKARENDRILLELINRE